MKDFLLTFLLTLLQALIIAAVPVITTYLCKYLAEKKNEASARAKNETAKRLISLAFDAVTKAVSMVNQTYVDTLKKEEKFSPENQKEAFENAYTAAMNLLTEEALEYLNTVYGSASGWLKTQIEAQVREQKLIYAAPIISEVSVNES